MTSKFLGFPVSGRSERGLRHRQAAAATAELQNAVSTTQVHHVTTMLSSLSACSGRALRHSQAAAAAGVPGCGCGAVAARRMTAAGCQLQSNADAAVRARCRSVAAERAWPQRPHGLQLPRAANTAVETRRGRHAGWRAACRRRFRTLLPASVAVALPVPGE